MQSSAGFTPDVNDAQLLCMLIAAYIAVSGRTTTRQHQHLAQPLNTNCPKCSNISCRAWSAVPPNGTVRPPVHLLRPRACCHATPPTLGGRPPVQDPSEQGCGLSIGTQCNHDNTHFVSVLVARVYTHISTLPEFGTQRVIRCSAFS